jgi:hypothetical protein
MQRKTSPKVNLVQHACFLLSDRKSCSAKADKFKKNSFFQAAKFFFFYSEKEVIHSTVIRQIGELN